MEGSYVVIKVKYGDMLRRFNVQVVDDEFDISIDGLREKIISLFGFLPASELTLTYIDEDGDDVTLSDDDDLHDVVKQALNPLRITVKLIDEKKDGKQKNNSSGSSTPRASSMNQQPPQNPDSLVHEVMRNVPEPVRDILAGLSADLTSKASSTSPVIAGIVDVFAKVFSSYMDRPSAAQTATQDNDLVDPDLTDAMNASLKLKSKEQHPVNMQSLEKLEREENVDTNGVKLDSVAGFKSEGSSSKAMESLDVEAFSQGSTLLHHFKSNLILGVGKKGKAKREMMRKIIEKHLSRKHHLAPNPPPYGKKHWGVDQSHEYSLPSDNSPAGSHNIDIEKQIDKTNGGIFAPNSASGSVSTTNPFQDPTDGGPKMPEFPSDPIAKNSGSFSGTSTQNVSAVPPRTALEPFPLVRSPSLQDGTGAAIHLGVRCDGCRVYPITGPRFKSKVKVDYDLCHDCFEEIGNNTKDYIRMDGPVVYPYQMPFKDLKELAKGRDPSLPKVVYVGAKVKPAESKLDSRFVQDVSIVDGTVLAPSVPFTKIWQLRNTGTVAWPPKTQLVWVGGDKLSNALSVEVNVPATGLLADHVLDVAVDLISPELPGRYISYWRLAFPSGQKFGQRFWVLIQVDASLRMTQQGGDRGFNLNLPPILLSPEITNIDGEMTMIEDMKELEPNSPKKKPLETVGPEGDSKESYDHELKFPINDSLIVGSGASNLNPSSSTSSVSYPIIDLSHLTLPPPRGAASQGNQYFMPPPPHYAAAQGDQYYVPPPPSHYAASQGNQYYVPPPPPPPPVPTQVNEEVEDDLLTKLKEMGFDNVGLNKEVLGLIGYDLMQAVDILSGFP